MRCYTRAQASYEQTRFAMKLNYRPFIVMLALLCPLLAQAETVLQGNAVIHYSKISSDRLALDIRPVEALPIDRVSAQLAGIDLPIIRSGDYPTAEQRTAIVFLVDTSDPRRHQAIDNNIQHINQLLGFQQDHHDYALARFDTDLHFLTPIGASADTIRQKATGLQAVGKTTELYRNTLGALRQLSRYPADRKFLFLLSDGRAEDQAYFHRDVVQAAVRDNISIYTIGYADSVSLTVSLQTLRRLSEETGGQYLSTQPGTYRLDQQSLQNMFDAINMGAQFQIDLSPALDAGVAGRQDISLSVMSGTTHSQISLPVKLPAAAVTATPSEQPAAATSVSVDTPAPQVIIERVSEPGTAGQPAGIFWLFLAVSALLLGLIVYVVIRLRDFPQRSSTLADDTVEPESGDAYAWLEIADNSNNPRRYPIRSTETKIGRYRGNDVTLHDSAISRYHAQIHFTDDGRFVISDMGSTNGILINDQEVLEQSLENGDIIEIGDVRLRFIIPEQLADDLQDTQIFKTVVPDKKSYA